MVVSCLNNRSHYTLPEDLIEVQFFGYQEGSQKHKKGFIEASHGGTLLINNIDALSLPIQASLVRCIERKLITRIGDHNEIKVDIRIIASSVYDLKNFVEEGKFRDDLYFGFVKIPIPPLRDRHDDIMRIARELLKKFAKQNRKNIEDFYVSAENSICAYEWFGNIRELENRIKRSVVMAEGTFITPKDLELPVVYNRPRPTLKEAREAFEREMIKEALIRCKGNITHTAEELGVSRPTLHDLMRKRGLQG